MEITYVVLVRLPAADETYEVRLHAGMNTNLAARLTAQALESLTDGQFQAAKTCLFAWQGTGEMLNTTRTLGENGVINGSRLLLV